MNGNEGDTAVVQTPRKRKPKPKPRKKALKRRNGSKKGVSRQVYPRPKKGEGVIGTILQCLQKDKGASVQEIFSMLKKKFKSKGDSMLTTIRIQVCSLPKRYGFVMQKKRDEKRGLVYKAPKSVHYDKPAHAKSRRVAK